MATAGDRLQIVIGAKDELSSQLRQTRKELTQLGRTANDIQKRMESGEQGLQDELEQTRREIGRVTQEHKDLHQQQTEVNREFRELTSSGRKAGDSIHRSFDRANRDLTDTHTKSKALSTGWAKLTGVVAGVTGAVAAAGFAFRFLGDSINEARDARLAMSQTAAVMRSMGRTEAPEKIDAMIGRLEALSGIDGDNIRELTNVLLTFGNVQGKTFEKANALALDLSVAFNKDLQSSAVMVGKALNDPVKGLTALSRIGVQFTQKQQDQITAMMEVNDIAGAQAIIMGELKRQVGGSAAAQADEIAKTQVAWGNLKEAVGEVLMSTAGFLAGTSNMDFAQGLRRATKWITKNGPKIQEVLTTIAGGALRVGQFFLVMAANTAEAIGGMLAVMEPLFWAMEKSGIPVLSDIGKALRGSGQKSLDAAAGMRRASESAGRLADKTFTARDRLEALNTALEKVDGKKVRVKISTTMQDVYSAIDKALEYALNIDTNFAGGPITAGTRSWVGELGPELFVPTYGTPRMVGADGPEIRDFHTSGTIIPHTLVGTYVAAQAAQTPAGGAVAVASPGVQIGELHVHDRWDAERELTALMRREERIRRERR